MFIAPNSRNHVFHFVCVRVCFFPLEVFFRLALYIFIFLFFFSVTLFMRYKFFVLAYMILSYSHTIALESHMKHEIKSETRIQKPQASGFCQIARIKTKKKRKHFPCHILCAKTCGNISLHAIFGCIFICYSLVISRVFHTKYTFFERMK